jgi:hypothetical protein
MEMLKTLKDKVMGTDEQNKAASERMKNNPMEKKFQKMMGNEPKEEDKKEMKPVSKAKGGMIKSSASKRADGCCIKGKTKGRMV